MILGKSFDSDITKADDPRQPKMCPLCKTFPRYVYQNGKTKFCHYESKQDECPEGYFDSGFQKTFQEALDAWNLRCVLAL